MKTIKIAKTLPRQFISDIVAKTIWYRDWWLVWRKRYVEGAGGGEGGSDYELLSVLGKVLNTSALEGIE